MNKIGTFLKYALVAVITVYFAFSASATFAVDEGVPVSGSENGNEVNVNPTGGSENGDEVDGGTIPPDNNPNGGGRNRNSGSRSNSAILSITDIQVTPVDSSTSTTVLTKGQTYTISWRASNPNLSISIDLAPYFLGQNISVGTSTNGANSLNWTVPISVTSGSYALLFTDSNNRTTNAPDVYTIENTPQTAATPTNSFGNGGGDTSPTGQGQPSSILSGEEISEDPSATLSEDPESFAPTQTATALDAFRDSFSNKYVFWSFILLLIIVGILALKKRKKQKF